MRFRAQALPRLAAFRKAGHTAKADQTAYRNSHRLEEKPAVRERIDYLIRQAQERIIEKRVALEEQLWAVLEADIGDCFETYEAAKTSKAGELATDQEGRMLTVRKQRAKLLSDLPADIRKLIEDVTVDRNGNVIPKLYSKLQANAELRRMLNIGGHQERQEPDDISRLSDAELIAQLAEQAKQLGVEINLNYDFIAAELPPAASEASEPTAVNGGQVIDNDSKAASASAVESGTADCSGADAQAARELATSALPASSQRPQDAPAGARKLQRNARSRP